VSRPRAQIAVAAATGISVETLRQRMRRRRISLAAAVALGPARPKRAAGGRGEQRRWRALRPDAQPCGYCARFTTGRDATGAPECAAGHGCAPRREARATVRLFRRCAQVAAIARLPVSAVWPAVARHGWTPEAAVERALERAGVPA
jgi:hypothetical protein